jgi:hypothetical protein
VGGVDPALGLVQGPLDAVNLVQGEGKTVVMRLSARRALGVDLDAASGVALDDASGPTYLEVFRESSSPFGPRFGVASTTCADLASGTPVRLEGSIVGSGAFYASARLDDFGLGSSATTPGILTNLEHAAGVLVVPATSRFELPATAYRHQIALTLDRAEPLGTLSPPSLSCSSAVDAGIDDAAAD